MLLWAGLKGCDAQRSYTATPPPAGVCEGRKVWVEDVGSGVAELQIQPCFLLPWGWRALLLRWKGCEKSSAWSAGALGWAVCNAVALS